MKEWKVERWLVIVVGAMVLSMGIVSAGINDVIASILSNRYASQAIRTALEGKDETTVIAQSLATILEREQESIKNPQLGEWVGELVTHIQQGLAKQRAAQRLRDLGVSADHATKFGEGMTGDEWALVTRGPGQLARISEGSAILSVKDIERHFEDARARMQHEIESVRNRYSRDDKAIVDIDGLVAYLNQKVPEALDKIKAMTGVTGQVLSDGIVQITQLIHERLEKIELDAALKIANRYIASMSDTGREIGDWKYFIEANVTKIDKKDLKERFIAQCREFGQFALEIMPLVVELLDDGTGTKEYRLASDADPRAVIRWVDEYPHRLAHLRTEYARVKKEGIGVGAMGQESARMALREAETLVETLRAKLGISASSGGHGGGPGVTPLSGPGGMSGVLAGIAGAKLHPTVIPGSGDGTSGGLPSVMPPPPPLPGKPGAGGLPPPPPLPGGVKAGPVVDVAVTIEKLRVLLQTTKDGLPADGSVSFKDALDAIPEADLRAISPAIWGVWNRAATAPPLQPTFSKAGIVQVSPKAAGDMGKALELLDASLKQVLVPVGPPPPLPGGKLGAPGLPAAPVNAYKKAGLPDDVKLTAVQSGLLIKDENAEAVRDFLGAGWCLAPSASPLDAAAAERLAQALGRAKVAAAVTVTPVAASKGPKILRALDDAHLRNCGIAYRSLSKECVKKLIAALKADRAVSDRAWQDFLDEVGTKLPEFLKKIRLYREYLDDAEVGAYCGSYEAFRADDLAKATSVLEEEGLRLPEETLMYYLAKYSLPWGLFASFLELGDEFDKCRTRLEELRGIVEYYESPGFKVFLRELFTTMRFALPAGVDAIQYFAVLPALKKMAVSQPKLGILKADQLLIEVFERVGASHLGVPLQQRLLSDVTDVLQPCDVLLKKMETFVNKNAAHPLVIKIFSPQLSPYVVVASGFQTAYIDYARRLKIIACVLSGVMPKDDKDCDDVFVAFYPQFVAPANAFVKNASKPKPVVKPKPVAVVATHGSVPTGTSGGPKLAGKAKRTLPEIVAEAIAKVDTIVADIDAAETAMSALLAEIEIFKGNVAVSMSYKPAKAAYTRYENFIARCVPLRTRLAAIKAMTPVDQEVKRAADQLEPQIKTLRDAINDEVQKIHDLLAHMKSVTASGSLAGAIPPGSI